VRLVERQAHAGFIADALFVAHALRLCPARAARALRQTRLEALKLARWPS
jgi:hypothetical protein